jgi:hypothetical protein
VTATPIAPSTNSPSSTPSFPFTNSSSLPPWNSSARAFPKQTVYTHEDFAALNQTVLNSVPVTLNFFKNWGGGNDQKFSPMLILSFLTKNIDASGVKV